MTFERKLKEAYEEARIEERKNAVIRLYNSFLEYCGSPDKTLRTVKDAYPDEDVIQILKEGGISVE